MCGKIGFLSLFYHSGFTGHDHFFILFLSWVFPTLSEQLWGDHFFYHSTFQPWKTSHAEIGVPCGSCWTCSDSELVHTLTAPLRTGIFREEVQPEVLKTLTFNFCHEMFLFGTCIGIVINVITVTTPAPSSWLIPGMLLMKMSCMYPKRLPILWKKLVMPEVHHPIWRTRNFSISVGGLPCLRVP